MHNTLEQIMSKNGSAVHFWSSRFFPKGVRDDVFKLYSFVKVVGDFVDKENPDIKVFENIEKRWKTIKKQLGKEMKRADDSLVERILSNVAYLVYRYECDPKWIDAFLKSMRMDIEKCEYETLDDILEYTYGSAEVIGLMMAKILQVAKTETTGTESDAMYCARMQGRAFQFMGFIRDIANDNNLGRCYFPKEDLVMFGLKDLSEHEATKKPAEFREFIEYQIERYRGWQKDAKRGFRYIPKRSRIAVRTVVDMYSWISKIIFDKPTLIYKNNIKPSKTRVLSSRVKRIIYG